MRSSLSSVIYSAIAITSVVAFTPSSPIIQQQHRLSSSLLKAVATETATGAVKWYNIERGFGFIEVDGGGPDMYVHATGLTFEGPLLDDDRVSFTTEIDPRTNKPKAVNVARTDSDAPAAEVEAEPAVESMVEKVMEIVKTELSDDEKKERSIKAETFQRARLAAQLAMPKPEPPAAASVDYDATVRLAYDAAGSSGDFDSFKTTYLADASAMVGKKYQDAAAADAAAAKASEEKKAAEAKAKKEAEEIAAAADAAAAKAAEEKNAAEAKAKKEAEEKAAAADAAAAKAAEEKKAAEAKAKKEAEEKAAAADAAAAKAAEEKKAAEAKAKKEAEEKAAAE